MKSNNLESIRSYIDNLQAQPGGASDAQVVAELDRFGITPAQFAQAYNVPVEGIQARYEAVKPPKSTSELGDKIFAGYQQLFGRPPDKDGFDYWMESFGGRDLDQAGINKSLLAGAQGSDVTSSLDYGLSLTGGRPDSVQDRVDRGQTGQFFQPILQLGRPKDYMPTERAPKQTFFSEGFNPLDYTAGPQVQSSGTYNPFFAGTSTDLGEQIAKGYQQVFGRPPDKDGYDYWMNSFAGQNLDQAGINKALFAGAQGEDISSSLMREGSENPYASRMQSMQGTPQTLQSRSVNSDVGTFNPFSGGQNTYTPGSFNPFSGDQNPYAARMQSLQGGPTQGNNIPAPLNNQPTGNPFIPGELASAPMPQNNPFLASYLAAYGQEGGVGQGGNVQGVSGQGDSGQGGTVG